MYQFRWKISKHRRDKDKQQKAIGRSAYAKQLFELGAGWNVGR